MKWRYFLLISVGAVAFALWTYMVEWVPFGGYLPRSGQTAERDFYFRVLAQHPVGSPEKALIEALRRQGFTTRRSREARFENEAVLRTNSPLCPRDWMVFWWTKQTDRITDITTRVRLDCLAI
jgi:hypothetical protein